MSNELFRYKQDFNLQVVRNKSSYHEVCIKENIHYQERSKFYPIKPIGIGTPYMECLSSYIIRLAGAHNVRFVDIVRSALLEVDKFIKKPSTQKVNGMGMNVSNILMGLEKLTLRSDLKLLGLLNWKGFVKNKNLIKDHKEWCPNCYFEWRRLGYILYEPLIWHVSGIHFCYNHHTHLMKTCNSCKNELDVNCDTEKIGYCSQCRVFLGQKLMKKECQISEKEREFADYLAENIVNARNVADLNSKMNSQSVSLKNVMDKVSREKSIAFSMFQESSSSFTFF